MGQGLAGRGGFLPNPIHVYLQPRVTAGALGDPAAGDGQGDRVSEMACTTTEGSRGGQPVGSRQRESGLVPDMKYLQKETVPEGIRS